MKYLKKFSSIQDANTQGGGNGLDSPHIDIIEGIRGVVNYAKIQGNYPFNCSFDNSGKIENVSPILPKFTVTLTAGQHGSVSGGGTYTQGTVITITATPDSGYKFSSWSDGDTNASRQITVDRDINLSCGFVEYQPNNEIWYTSTDGNILEINNADMLYFLNANVVSNIYNNGRGVITFDSNITQCVGHLFTYGSKLKSIILPEGVVSIVSTFIYGKNGGGYGSLSTLVLPQSLNSIWINGYYTFPTNCEYIYKGTLSQWQSVIFDVSGPLQNPVDIQCSDNIGIFYCSYMVCFAKGTQITMADNTTKNIEDIKKGDVVLGWDEENKTTVNTVIQSLLIRQTTKTYILSSDDFEVEATGEHRLYVNNDWVAVENIKIGDKLLHSDGTYMEVTSIKEKIKEQTVYNLDCEENDTFFANGVLAHNGY